MQVIVAATKNNKMFIHQITNKQKKELIQISLLSKGLTIKYDRKEGGLYLAL